MRLPVGVADAGTERDRRRQQKPLLGSSSGAYEIKHGVPDGAQNDRSSRGCAGSEEQSQPAMRIIVPGPGKRPCHFVARRYVHTSSTILHVRRILMKGLVLLSGRQALASSLVHSGVVLADTFIKGK